MLSKYIVLLLVLTSILPVILGTSMPKPTGGLQILQPYLIEDPLPPAAKDRGIGSWAGKRNRPAIKQHKRNMPDIIIDIDKLKSRQANLRLLAKLQQK